MNVGDCYKTQVNGGYTYARVVSERGSGMFRADVIRVTNGTVNLEMNSLIMDWYFRTYTQINPQEYEHVIQNLIWELELMKSGEKRNVPQKCIED